MTTTVFVYWYGRQHFSSTSAVVLNPWELISQNCPLKGPVEWSESCSILSNFLRPHGLYSPWNSPGQNTGVGSLSLLCWIFPTQELNWGLLHCRGFFTNWATREVPKARRQQHTSVTAHSPLVEDEGRGCEPQAVGVYQQRLPAGVGGAQGTESRKEAYAWSEVCWQEVSESLTACPSRWLKSEVNLWACESQSQKNQEHSSKWICSRKVLEDTGEML